MGGGVPGRTTGADAVAVGAAVRAGGVGAARAEPPFASDTAGGAVDDARLDATAAGADGDGSAAASADGGTASAASADGVTAAADGGTAAAEGGTCA